MYPPPRPMNSLAIAAIFVAAGFGPIGIVLGFMARRQIKRTGERGLGVATAAIFVGIAQILTVVLIVLGYLAFFAWLGNELTKTG